ncbi:MAG: 50S ribosomal protein L30 [Clostridiales bacterium]|nr:50S ribosomal protein L30 [Clostridiales bacterium]MCF8022403.1 50S ribosomal protein L30 [Clostridiales bacterium]
MADKIKITLIRSCVGRPQKQRDTVSSLGLRKINSTVIKENSPQVKGMIDKVSHMVKVEPA